MKLELVRPLITDKIRGRIVDFVGVQGECLVIVATDGQAYRIGWRDSTTQELVPGSPSLEGIDMKIVIDPLEISGTAGF